LIRSAAPIFIEPEFFSSVMRLPRIVFMPPLCPSLLLAPIAALDSEKFSYPLFSSTCIPAPSQFSLYRQQSQLNSPSSAQSTGINA
jgi:hypothetical protein